jgi:hypothetical protein
MYSTAGPILARLSAAQYNANGTIANGFGFIGNGISNAGGTFAPRSGEFVARFQF